MVISANKILDVTGLSCPMPIVKTKKAFSELENGQVIEVQATDKGSTADIKSWAESTGQEYLGTIIEGETLKHYLRKSNPNESSSERKHEITISNQELLKKINNGEEITILDVRENAEYSFGHIPGAVSIPLGELENHLGKIDMNKDIYVICRTGNRSDLASQKLASKGFKKVTNVSEGMSKWTGNLKTNENGGI